MQPLGSEVVAGQPADGGWHALSKGHLAGKQREIDVMVVHDPHAAASRHNAGCAALPRSRRDQCRLDARQGEGSARAAGYG